MGCAKDNDDEITRRDRKRSGDRLGGVGLHEMMQMARVERSGGVQ